MKLATVPQNVQNISSHIQFEKNVFNITIPEEINVLMNSVSHHPIFDDDTFHTYPEKLRFEEVDLYSRSDLLLEIFLLIPIICGRKVYIY